MSFSSFFISPPNIFSIEDDKTERVEETEYNDLTLNSVSLKRSTKLSLCIVLKGVTKTGT
jgi:hypothetical protein